MHHAPAPAAWYFVGTAPRRPTECYGRLLILMNLGRAEQFKILSCFMSHHRSESSDSSPAEWWCGVVVTGDPCGNLVHNDLLLYQMAALSFLICLFATTSWVVRTIREGSSVVVVAGHLSSSSGGSSNIITCGYTNSGPRWSCLNSGSEDSSLLRTSHNLHCLLVNLIKSMCYLYFKVLHYVCPLVDLNSGCFKVEWNGNVPSQLWFWEEMSGAGVTV